MVRFLEHRGDERPVFRNRVHRFAEGGTALNNQTQVFRLLEICLGRSKRVL
jgi:hypothetical protein